MVGVFITDQHRAQIQAYFAEMNHYIQILDKLKHSSREEFLTDPVLQAAAERALHIALESATDAGNMIIDALIMRDPSSYEDIIQVLADENLFPPEFTASFMELIRYRRVLAHDYTERDGVKLYDMMQGHAHEFVLFQNYVADYVKLGSHA